jgi:uncharacterized protein YkwD
VKVAWALALACCLAAAAHAQPQADNELIAALANARATGCAGQPPVQSRLRPVGPLNAVAQRIARGESPADASKSAGYRSTRLFVVNLSGYRSPRAVAKAIADKHCKALSDPELTDVGFHQRGDSWWLVFGAPFAPPPASQASAVAARVLMLANEARSHPRRCGSTSFEAATPLAPNPLLERAAALHAQDMAQHSYLEHRGRDGSSPADRVTRARYRWRSVGENIAAGQTTPDQVVQEWIRSPEHCANLMNPGFTEMGVAFAVNVNSEAGIYWAQELARPR